MTIRDALHELGIEDGATPDAVRRAYLRGVKIRKPETDPEGFRRLREAYELLQRAGADADADAFFSGDPMDLIAQAEVLAAGDQAAEAAACALKALAAAERRPPTEDFNQRVIGLILRLLAAGALAEAEAVYDELEDHFERAGGEVTLISPSTAVTWSLVNEIMRLSEDFPQGMRAAFALAAEAEDLDTALLDLSRLCRLDRQAAERAKAEIRHLPLLASAYWSLFPELTVLTDPRPPRRPVFPKKAANFRLDFLIVSGLILSVALVSHLPAVLKRADTSPPPKPEITLTELRAQLAEVCTQLDPGKEERRCASAAEALDLLERRQCRAAHEAVVRLHRSFSSANDPSKDPPKLWAIADGLLDADTHCQRLKKEDL